ncbi:UbiA family prenyltransferase [Crocinitomix algicola]|uniref:UbiA family prenyltransferase n=1 Tax=Crocinitomix algicola TaxID=1740263 RepID=UPI000872A13A|nr:UbiA family prenyltransferase [Crocinitomix algicola]
MKTPANPSFNRLSLFGIAAVSLSYSGLLFRKFIASDIIHLGLLVFFGVILVYRVNHAFYFNNQLRKNLVHFFSFPLHLLAFLIAIFTGIHYYTYANQMPILILIIGGSVGGLYAIPLTIKSKTVRLKNVIFMKNIVIGFVWGTLVIAGAYPIISRDVLWFFFAVFMQVFMGSVIRDMPDIKSDVNLNINTIPGKYGRKMTLILLHSTNLLVLLTLFLSNASFNIQITFYFIFIARAINLIGLAHGSNHIFWTQFYNLNICTLIFILFLIFKL